MSPELLFPGQFGLDASRPTKPSDCYSLGMVIYETISGKPPFQGTIEAAVGVTILNGGRPPREVGFMESLWKMMEQCWRPQPSDRPRVAEVLQCLEACSSRSTPPSPGTGKCAENPRSHGLSHPMPDINRTCSTPHPSTTMRRPLSSIKSAQPSPLPSPSGTTAVTPNSDDTWAQVLNSSSSSSSGPRQDLHLPAYLSQNQYRPSPSPLDKNQWNPPPNPFNQINGGYQGVNIFNPPPGPSHSQSPPISLEGELPDPPAGKICQQGETMQCMKVK